MRIKLILFILAVLNITGCAEGGRLELGNFNQINDICPLQSAAANRNGECK